MKEEAGIEINSHCTLPGKGTATVKSAYSHDIEPSFKIDIL